MGGRLLQRGRGGVALAIERTLEPVFWAPCTLVTAVISHPAPLQPPNTHTHTPPKPPSPVYSQLRGLVSLLLARQQRNRSTAWHYRVCAQFSGVRGVVMRWRCLYVKGFCAPMNNPFFFFFLQCIHDSMCLLLSGVNVPQSDVHQVPRGEEWLRPGEPWDSWHLW